MTIPLPTQWIAMDTLLSCSSTSPPLLWLHFFRTLFCFPFRFSFFTLFRYYSLKSPIVHVRSACISSWIASIFSLPECLQLNMEHWRGTSYIVEGLETKITNTRVWILKLISWASSGWLKFPLLTSHHAVWAQCCICSTAKLGCHGDGNSCNVLVS